MNPGGLTNQPKNYLYPLALEPEVSLEELPLEVLTDELPLEGALDLLTVLWLMVSLFGAAALIFIAELLLVFEETFRV